MPLLDQTRETKLIELAKTRFSPDLTEAELKVLRDSASSEDLPEPDEKAPRPEIRAAFLRWLATDPEAAPHIDPKGLRVYAATIPGQLDLRECTVNPTLVFFHCDFQGEMNLQSAETRGLFFFDSSLAGGIRADWVVVHGPLFLQRIHSEGEIRLLGAEIEGVLNCPGAKLKAKGDALYADGAKIGGDVFLRDGFESEGEIRLLGAEIKGDLSCNGAKLNATGNALFADRVKISGGVFLTDGFESEGAIRLLGAEITGQLNCKGAKLKAAGNALHADGAKIGGDVFLIDGFESEGTIRLLGAEIKGDLSCNGAKLNATGDALSADGAQIGGSVFLTDGFESEGTIRLPGAAIGGDLTVRGAKVTGVLCKDTIVKGDLAWQRIEKSEETSLSLAGAKVKNLRDDKLSWPGEGNLDLDGLVYEELTLHAPSSDENLKAGTYPSELPLVAKERIDWIMLQPEDWRTEPQPWMQIRDLLERKDDRKGAKYVLFRFRCLQAKQKMFTPLLWLKGLILFVWKAVKYFVGNPKKAFRRLWPYFRHPNRSFAIAFAWLEENPLRICYSIAFTLALGTLVFAGAWRSGAMIQTMQVQPAMMATYEEATTKPSFVKPDSSSKPISIHYPRFQPFIYTLENAVPLIKLGMDDKWMPDPKHEPHPWFPRIRWLDWLASFNSYGFLVWFRWALIVWGWTQATILAASLVDRFKK